MSNLHRQSFTIPSLRAAYRDGISPAAVIEEVYRRIESIGDPGIFISLLEQERALEQAASLGRQRKDEQPLWGVPFAVKDNIDVAGLPTTAACPAFAYEPNADAFVIGALREAGAIPIGKTNLDQFATGLVGLRTPYGVPINAFDPSLIPGGSSSGSAVSVAHGMVTFALGTDTAGSGRIPAALNNIVGLKPTLGTVSASGVVPACRTLDTVSVLALTVEDAYEVYRSAAGFDPQDAYARPYAVPRSLPMAPKLRVGVPSARTREFLGDAGQAAMFESALEALRHLGCDIVPIDFTPFQDVASMLYSGAWVAERFAVVESLYESNPDAIHPVTRSILGGAASLSAVDAFRDFYRLKSLARSAETAMAGVDVICCPSAPTYFEVDEVMSDPIGTNSKLGTYTNFVNLLDLCGVAVPTAMRSDGRPGSVTLLARAGSDATVCALAGALHRHDETTLGATGWSLDARPSSDEPAVSESEIEIGVVGAHMFGLPLNGELTRLGGRFLRTTRTMNAYQLYRLAGGAPLRPGLLRVADGHAIELEVWALPRARFADFVSGIPQPLGIGTLDLEGNRQVQGFLCEPEGLAGATDISAHGGWRAYLRTMVDENKPRTMRQKK